MGLEKFFFKLNKESTVETDVPHDSAASENSNVSRRNFLLGGAALAATTLLNTPKSEAKAKGEYDKLEAHLKQNPEEKLKNVAAIRDYEWRIQQLKDLLSIETSGGEVMRLIGDVPPTSEPYLEGTELDHRPLFEKQGSWPSVQVRSQGQETHIRFGHHKNDESPAAAWNFYGNGFFIGETFFSNRHVIRDSFACEIINDRIDIGSCSVHELHQTNDIRADVERVATTWDRRQSVVDMHGHLVHIPSIHEQRGSADTRDRDITSGVPIKITENMLWSVENPDALFNSESSKLFAEELKKSYFCIVPARNTNLDSIKDGDDAKGTSGSPVFLDRDCASGIPTASGILWGIVTFEDEAKKVSYTAVLIHGPDVIGEMVDISNTVLSSTMDEAQFPEKLSLTLSVQYALLQLKYNIPTHGVYDQQTIDAVRTFQEQNFDIETLASKIIPGVIDRYTWNALFPNKRADNKKQLYASVSESAVAQVEPQHGLY